jgi:hypothetical protein
MRRIRLFMSRRTIFTWCIAIAVITVTTAFLIWRYPSPKPELSAQKHLEDCLNQLEISSS